MAEARHPLLAAERLILLSDLHLSDDTPLTLSALTRLLAGVAGSGVAIVLLGDIFEYWVGDDHQSAVADAFAEGCHAATDKGASLFFMAGNRDFLLGDSYLKRCQLQHLTDPWTGTLLGIPTALSHGDLLCTDDLAYQQFRQMSRGARWQTDFLSKPLPERVAYAEHLRAESRKVKATTASDIMDVNPEAVTQALRGHWPGTSQETQPTRRLIHGHTHRPACHPLSINGESAERWVLPDWDFDSLTSDGQRQSRGYALEVTADGIRFSHPPTG